MQKLIDKIENNDYWIPEHIKKEALEEEKKEIMNAHGEEEDYLQDNGSWKRLTAEEYYNQTYNQNK